MILTRDAETNAEIKKKTLLTNSISKLLFYQLTKPLACFSIFVVCQNYLKAKASFDGPSIHSIFENLLLHLGNNHTGFERCLIALWGVLSQVHIDRRV